MKKKVVIDNLCMKQNLMQSILYLDKNTKSLWQSIIFFMKLSLMYEAINDFEMYISKWINL